MKSSILIFGKRIRRRISIKKTHKIYNEIFRLAIYAAGIWMVSLGIVLCKKSDLGISPISCIPYVLEKLLPLSFGTLTMLFHLVNIFLQLLLKRKADKRILLQVIVAVVFGWVIDLVQGWIFIDNGSMVLRLAALVLSVLFTALGMLCMVNMNLLQNPPDGCVKLMGECLRKDFGKVKIFYDIACVVIAAGIGLIFTGSLEGIGIGTIVSALCVGRTVTGLRRCLGRLSKVLYPSSSSSL